MVKKAKTLKEVDELVLGKIGKSIKIKEAMPEEDIPDVPKCKKCAVGNMEKVIPLIEMTDLILHECDSCGEREYL